MSTILDSLKKSSHSRGDNEKASIDSFSFSEKTIQNKSRSPIFLILFVLTGISLYIGYLYLYPSSDDVETTPTEKLQSVQKIQDDTPSGPSSKTTIVQNKSVSKIEKPDSNKVKKILQKESSINKKIGRNVSRIQNKPVNIAKESNNFQDLNKPLINTGAQKPQIKNPSQINQQKPTDINVQRKVNTQRSSIQNYKLAYQLPFAVRKDLPELILNIHVYDENPNNRIVIINGEKFEVNALIGEEVLVKEIVLEGVVLEFKNETFLLPKL